MPSVWAMAIHASRCAANESTKTPSMSKITAGCIGWFSVDVTTDNLILISLVEFTKIAAPAPDAHNKILVLFRMQLSIFEGLDIESVDLKLLAAHRGKQTDEQGHLVNVTLNFQASKGPDGASPSTPRRRGR